MTPNLPIYKTTSRTTRTQETRELQDSNRHSYKTTEAKTTTILQDYRGLQNFKTTVDLRTSNQQHYNTTGDYMAIEDYNYDLENYIATRLQEIIRGLSDLITLNLQSYKTT